MTQEARTERYKAAQDKRGMVQVKVWVPRGEREEIKRYATVLREDWLCYRESRQ